MLLGEDLFHPLTFCGVFQRSIDVFKAEPIAFFVIGGIGAIPSLSCNWLVLPQKDLENLDSDEAQKQMLENLKAPLVALLPIIVISIVLKVATIRSTVQVYINQKPVLRKDLKHGLRLVPRMFSLSLVFFGGLLITGYIVLLCIIVITILLSLVFGNANIILPLLMFCLELALPHVVFCLVFWKAALVMEDLPHFRPFFRSYDLVKEQWCFVFCALLHEGVAILGINLLIVLLFNNVGFAMVLIAQALFGVVATPCAGIFVTVLCLNSRITQEECNCTILTQEMDPERG